MLRQTNLCSWGSAWVLVLTLAACGDNGNGDSADKESLKNLTAEESAALCEDIAKDINGVDLTRHDCLQGWEILQIIHPEKTCEEYVDECVAERSGGPQGDKMVTCTKTFDARIKNCDADVTVGDLKGCIAKWKSVLEENATATCENPPTEERLDFGEPPDVAECDEVIRCFNDDRDGGIGMHMHQNLEAGTSMNSRDASDDGGE